MATDSVSEARAMVYRGLPWHTVREKAGAEGGLCWRVKYEIFEVFMKSNLVAPTAL